MYSTQPITQLRVPGNSDQLFPEILSLETSHRRHYGARRCVARLRGDAQSRAGDPASRRCSAPPICIALRGRAGGCIISGCSNHRSRYVPANVRVCELCANISESPVQNSSDRSTFRRKISNESRRFKPFTKTVDHGIGVSNRAPHDEISPKRWRERRCVITLFSKERNGNACDGDAARYPVNHR
jgi:hypothetical protein